MSITMGDIIRSRRKDLGWSIDRLADKSGLGKSHISEIETGKRTHTEFESMRKLCKALGLSMDKLGDNDDTLGGSERMFLVGEEDYKIMEFLRGRGISTLAVLTYVMAIDEDEQNCLNLCRQAKDQGIIKDVESIVRYELNKRSRQNPSIKIDKEAISKK